MGKENCSSPANVSVNLNSTAGGEVHVYERARELGKKAKSPSRCTTRLIKLEISFVIESTFARGSFPPPPFFQTSFYDFSNFLRLRQIERIWNMEIHDYSQFLA